MTTSGFTTTGMQQDWMKDLSIIGPTTVVIERLPYDGIVRLSNDNKDHFIYTRASFSARLMGSGCNISPSPVMSPESSVAITYHVSEDVAAESAGFNAFLMEIEFMAGKGGLSFKKISKSQTHSFITLRVIIVLKLKTEGILSIDTAARLLDESKKKRRKHPKDKVEEKKSYGQPENDSRGRATQTNVQGRTTMISFKKGKLLKCRLCYKIGKEFLFYETEPCYRHYKNVHGENMKDLGFSFLCAICGICGNSHTSMITTKHPLCSGRDLIVTESERVQEIIGRLRGDCPNSEEESEEEVESTHKQLKSSPLSSVPAATALLHSEQLNRDQFDDAERSDGVDGIAAIQRLARSAPDSSLRLWLSGALAAAMKSDLTTVVECLSRVPLAAKLTFADRNGAVVDVLIQLIEREVEGAEEALTPYLYLSGDGTTLHERHASNSTLVFKARRAVNEGKMDVATRLYALAHVVQRNKFVEYELKKGMQEMGRNEETRVEDAKRCAMRMQDCAIIPSANAFLLCSFYAMKQVEFIQQLRSTGTLSDAVAKCKVHKFALATQLIKQLESSPLSSVPAATALLHSEQLNRDQFDDAERIIFKGAKEDPAVIVKILEELAHSHMADAEFLGKFIASAAIGRILLETDVLSSGRIEKILSSPFVPGVRLMNLEYKLIRILRMVKDEESTERATEIASHIIIAAFKTSGKISYCQQILVKIVGNAVIPNATMEILVNKLSNNPSVGLGSMEMERAQKELGQRGLKKRVQLLGLLKLKSQASQRWLATPAESLEKELIQLEDSGKVPRPVLEVLKGILMNKLLEDMSLPSDRMIALMERVIPTIVMRKKKEVEDETNKWDIPRLIRLRESTEKVYRKTMWKCVMDKDWNGASRLWKAKGTLHSLPISSCLALAYNEFVGGSKELSGDIISYIRSSGHSVGTADLTELGELIIDLPMDEVSKVSEWMKKELRLEDKDVERIKNARTKRRMGELINEGRLEDAFNVMKENSEKTRNAIGHFDVMRAAVRDNNGKIVESTMNLVSSLHSKPSAMLDLAYSILLENRKELAEKLLRNPTLKLSHAKLSFYIKNSVDEQRPDVVHALFSILVSCPLTDEKVSNADLNYLAAAALKAYVKSGKMEGANELMGEIEKSTLVVERQLKELIDRTKNTSRSSSV